MTLVANSSDSFTESLMLSALYSIDTQEIVEGIPICNEAISLKSGLNEIETCSIKVSDLPSGDQGPFTMKIYLDGNELFGKSSRLQSGFLVNLDN